jgi:hypothetical protein
VLVTPDLVAACVAVKTELNESTATAVIEMLRVRIKSSQCFGTLNRSINAERQSQFPLLCPLRANSGHSDLFDDFVGARENWWREGQIERFRGFEINYEFELAGLQYGQVCGICAFKDTGDEVTSLTIRLRQTGAVAH